jgi:hypothetical protein
MASYARDVCRMRLLLFVDRWTPVYAFLVVTVVHARAGDEASIQRRESARDR